MDLATGEAVANERPQHEVSFFLPSAVGGFEVTFANWDACVAEGACPRAGSLGGPEV